MCIGKMDLPSMVDQGRPELGAGAGIIRYPAVLSALAISKAAKEALPGRPDSALTREALRSALGKEPTQKEKAYYQKDGFCHFKPLRLS